MCVAFPFRVSLLLQMCRFCFSLTTTRNHHSLSDFVMAMWQTEKHITTEYATSNKSRNKNARSFLSTNYTSKRSNTDESIAGVKMTLPSLNNQENDRKYIFLKNCFVQCLYIAIEVKFLHGLTPQMLLPTVVWTSWMTHHLRIVVLSL